MTKSQHAQEQDLSKAECSCAFPNVLNKMAVVNMVYWSDNIICSSVREKKILVRFIHRLEWVKQRNKTGSNLYSVPSVPHSGTFGLPWSLIKYYRLVLRRRVRIQWQVLLITLIMAAFLSGVLVRQIWHCGSQAHLNGLELSFIFLHTPLLFL